MKIIYLGNDENINLDFDENIVTYIDIPKSLTAFVSRTAGLKDCQFVVLDLRNVEFSNEHILSAVQMLNQFSSADIIYIANDSEETKILFAHLLDFDIRNVISCSEKTDLIKEIKHCLDGNRSIADLASTRLNGIRETNKAQTGASLKIPEEVVVNIAVLGVCNRIGTTTHAIGIFHYLKSLGFNPMIVDKASTIDTYMKHQPDHIIAGDFVKINNVIFDVNERKDGKINANVFDLSNKPNKFMPDILSADIVVLVSGTKLLEVLHLANTLHELSFVPDENFFHIVSFSDKQEFEDMIQNLRGKAFLAGYSPNIWKENNSFYADVLFQKIKEICND